MLFQHMTSHKTEEPTTTESTTTEEPTTTESTTTEEPTTTESTTTTTTTSTTPSTTTTSTTPTTPLSTLNPEENLPADIKYYWSQAFIDKYIKEHGVQSKRSNLFNKPITPPPIQNTTPGAFLNQIICGIFGC
uniref:Uncharacterized protein n=1 Tax=Cacopsylla melanoneura TaxID=428564 RepID=A0A8D8ZIF4_9HEMI